MDMPYEELGTHLERLDDLTDVDEGSRCLAVLGRAKSFSRLVDFTDLEELWAADVTMEQLSIITRLPKLWRLVLHGPRIEDFSPLASLRGLQKLVINGNTKCESLAPLGALERLSYLYLGELKKVSNIDPLSKLENLRTLGIEGGMYWSMKLESLRPLETLSKLRELRLASIRVEDQSLRPLHHLEKLENFFIADVFSLEECAALSAALPAARGNLMEPYSRPGYACDKCSEPLVLPTGRRTSFLCPHCDAAKLKRRIAKFEALKQQAMAGE